MNRSTDTRLRWSDEEEVWLEDTRQGARTAVACVAVVATAVAVSTALLIVGAIAALSGGLS